jgi:hypothetical protein
LIHSTSQKTGPKQSAFRPDCPNSFCAPPTVGAQKDLRAR